MHSPDESTVVSVAEKEDGEINGFEEFTIESDINENGDNEGSLRKIVIFSVVLIFALTGVMVNLLVLLSMKANKRTLILPWLVYHTGAIIGELSSLILLGIILASNNKLIIKENGWLMCTMSLISF